jgi:ubiquinone/menaquinone biosynthesis C-methylase UbiE
MLLFTIGAYTAITVFLTMTEAPTGGGNSTMSTTASDNAYIIDHSSGAEMARLINFQALITRKMGGLLPVHLNPANLQNALDVACGPGAWVTDVAFAWQHIEVMGIDLSQPMIEYARALTQVRRLDNASFQIMDATRPLAFPDASFDLINARLLLLFMSPNGWLPLIKELIRVCKPGGSIYIVEVDEKSATTSSAMEEFNHLIARALQKRCGTETVIVAPQLACWMREAGCCDIVETEYCLDYSYESPYWMESYSNVRAFYGLVQPFLRSAGVAKREDLERLYPLILREMYLPEFRAAWRFRSVRGQRPDYCP